MISNSLLGRYESHKDGSAKYWHIVFDKTTQMYVAQWGKITASRPIGTKIYTAKEALAKIKEKTGDRKGYRKVLGYDEDTGSNSLHAIFGYSKSA